MKLGTFISGVFGTLGFGLSVLAGLSAGNTVEAILTRGLLCAGVCYAVGYCVGAMAQQVSLEHAAHVSKIIADQDKAAEQKRLEEQAAADQEAAQTVAEGAGAAANASPLSR
ncbi:MAG TPA: hypothetical protein VHM90_15920 [Phycisphaerae bacterium]|jgi:hypothetical protein|nr:hypothetical protein [Phycisphaerae bacterium]